MVSAYSGFELGFVWLKEVERVEFKVIRGKQMNGACFIHKPNVQANY